MKHIPDKLNEIKGLRPYGKKHEQEYYVYFLCDLNEVVYIGRTDILKNRLKEHRMNKKTFKDCYYIKFPNKDIAIKNEKQLILSIKPKYNIQYLYEQVYPVGVGPTGECKIAVDTVKLKNEMKDKNLSLYILARKSNIYPNSIYHLFKNKTTSQTTLKRISQTLGIDPKNLII